MGLTTENTTKTSSQTEEFLIILGEGDEFLGLKSRYKVQGARFRVTGQGKIKIHD